MLKQILVFIVTLAITLSVSAQSNSACSLLIQGRQVKTEQIESAQFTLNNDKYVEGKKVVTKLTAYAADGAQRETKYYDTEGTLVTYSIENCVEGKSEGSASYDADGTLRYRSTTKTVANSVEDNFFKGNGSLLQRRLTDFKEGEAVEERIYQSPSSLAQQWVLVSAANNNQIWEGRSADGENTGKRIFEKFAEESRHEIINYKQDGSGESRTIQTYRYDGRHTQETIYRGDGAVIHMESTESEHDPNWNWGKILKKHWSPATKKLEPFSIEYHTYIFY